MTMSWMFTSHQMGHLVALGPGMFDLHESTFLFRSTTDGTPFFLSLFRLSSTFSFFNGNKCAVLPTCPCAVLGSGRIAHAQCKCFLAKQMFLIACVLDTSSCKRAHSNSKTCGPRLDPPVIGYCRRRKGPIRYKLHGTIRTMPLHSAREIQLRSFIGCTEQQCLKICHLYPFRDRLLTPKALRTIT